MRTLISDLKLTFRGLLRNPVFTVFAVLSLALGIGANTAIFSAVNGVLLHPLGVADASRVVVIFTLKKDRLYPLSFQEYEHYKLASTAFSDMAVGRGCYVSMVEGESAERIVGRLVSENYFDLLGVDAHLGRLFTAGEDRTPGAAAVIVLGYHYWQKRFAGDPEVVGRTLTLNGNPFTVIGVTAEDFKGLSTFNVRDYWIPVSNYDVVLTGTLRKWFDLPDGRIFQGFGRLAPGASVAAARAEMESLARARAEELPESNEGFGIELIPLLETKLSPNPDRRQAYFRAGTGLMIVTVLLLFIAAANVANLLLARALSRRKEIALRTALGSARGRLARQFFTEGAVLAVLGCAAGLLIAVWGRNLLWALRPPFILEKWGFPLSTGVLSFGFALALAVAVFFGLAPLAQAFKVDLVSSLKEDADPAAGGLRRRWSLRTVLVVLQVAVSLLSLIGAGLFIRSLQNTRETDLGFDDDKLVVISFDLGTRGYEEEQGQEFFRRIVERVEAVPGVVAAAVSEKSPLIRATGFLAAVEILGADPPPDGEWDLIRLHTVGPGYFETMGIPLLAGRDFHRQDRAGTPRVAIINETMAKRYWPESSAVGRGIKFTDEEEPLEVIAVARDSTYVSLGESPQPYIYLPVAQGYISDVTLHARTAGPPSALVESVRRAAQSLDKDLAFYRVGVLSELIEETLWPALLSARLLSLFGVLALVLTAIGVFGVLTFEIVQRRREIGIRMAVGGKRSNILGWVLARCLRLTVAGIVLGTIGAFASFRLVSGLLVGMSGLDPLSVLVSALVLAGIGLLAGLVAGRRAVTIDPLEALRYE